MEHILTCLNEGFILLKDTLIRNSGKATNSTFLIFKFKIQSVQHSGKFI
jgi:hypothetical protein